MKPVRLKRLATALAIAGVSAVLVGCGSHNNDSATAPIVTSPNGTIPGTVLPGGGGCVPINQAIPFTAQGIYFSYANIVGGYVPGNQQPIGQVVIGGAAQGGQFSRNAVDLNISMNIIPNQVQYNGQYPTGYPNSIYPGTVPTGYQNPQYSGIPGYNTYGQTPGLANATGVITINPATQQEIMAQFGGMTTGTTGYPYTQNPYGTGTTYPYGTGQVPCVSGIAFNLGNYNGVLYGGFVWLYLNGTQHGVYYPI